MNALDLVQTSKKQVPRRVLLYGTHGVGKSTLAASQFPSPVFISTEDGIADIDVPSFPLAENIDDVWRYCVDLAGGNHSYQTLVIDSLDWLESMMSADICVDEGKEALTDFDYGRGVGLLLSRMQTFLKNFAACRAIGMHVVLISHCASVKFESPIDDSYDRYAPKLQSKVSLLFQEWADEVLFMNFRTYTREVKEGFGRTRSIAMGGEERVIFTENRAGWLAKNRCGLPCEMSADIEEYKPFINLNVRVTPESKITRKKGS